MKTGVKDGKRIDHREERIQSVDMELSLLRPSILAHLQHLQHFVSVSTNTKRVIIFKFLNNI